MATESSQYDESETVSVIIPCYNEERFIGKALEQLADQFEQIVMRSSWLTACLTIAVVR